MGQPRAGILLPIKIVVTLGLVAGAAGLALGWGVSHRVSRKFAELETRDVSITLSRTE